MEDLHVPVTSLTGFPGVGKTALLNAILSDGTAGRVAIIVNKFGDVGLDHDLFQRSGQDVIFLRSGCLRCSVSGDLSDTGTRLFDRKLAGEIDFERIVIETKGLAYPGPIMQTLIVDNLLANNKRLDGIVTVVDAANGAGTLDARFEAVSQAVLSNLLVISKTDLATPVQVQGFEEYLHALDPSVQIVHAIHGEGLTGQLLGLNALQLKAAKKDVLPWVSVPKGHLPDHVSTGNYIQSHWQEPWGDHHQEVFIGADIHWAALTTKLDACLVPTMLAAGTNVLTLDMPDPFPGWRRVEDAA